ncbi:MAG: polysaccharide biosynthesis protein [Anaerovoracaceae bacterium]|jgi:stage V sporulation protein B
MTPEVQKNKTFLKGALILGVAGLTIKALGAVFRIPLTNIIGDGGMGYYQTAYPIYVLFLTIATAGLPTAISRMVAERLAVDEPGEAHRVFRLSFRLLLSIGLVSSALLYFGAGHITALIREPEAVHAMKATAPALFFVPLMASFRGYFQGRQNMAPTAMSQVVEQLFRVSIGLGLAVYFLPKGLQYAAAGASFGASAGGLFGLLGIGLLYMRHRSDFAEGIACANREAKQSSRAILWGLLIIAVPITVGAAIMPIINAIDTAIVKARLMQIGYDSDIARGLYGQLTGMAAPLINFPQILTQAVAMSLVPVVASAYRRGQNEFMRENIALGLRLALLLSIPAASGMAVLARPIMLLIYPLQKESAINAASCLAILAWGIVFLATIQILTGVLQGVGKQIIPVRNLLAGAAVKIVLTYVLTGIPSINVRGAAAGTVAAYLTAAVLNIAAVKKYTGVAFDLQMTLVQPLLSAGVMSLSVVVVHRTVSAFAGSSLATLLSVAVGVAVYFYMVLATGAVTVEELSALPQGDKLARLFGRWKKVV